MELLKKSETQRANTIDEALDIISQKVNEALGSCEIKKVGCTLKTKKSKGEIIDSWYVVDIEYLYEE